RTPASRLEQRSHNGSDPAQAAAGRPCRRCGCGLGGEHRGSLRHSRRRENGRDPAGDQTRRNPVGARARRRGALDRRSGRPRVDPDSGSTVGLFSTASAPTALVVANGFVWVANAYSGTVSRIDPNRGTLTTIPVGGDPTALAPATAAGHSSVWIGTGPRDLHR